MRNKYKIALLVIGIMILATSYMGVSYSLWVRTIEGKETNTIQTGCFTITFEELSKSISLTNTYPISDGRALTNIKPYTLRVSNICDTTDAGYAITLNTLQIPGTKLDDGKVKVAVGIGDQKPVAGSLLSDMSINNDVANIEVNGTLDTSYIINTGYIEKAGTKTFNIYLWIDESAGNEVMGQGFQAGIVVTTYATKVSAVEATVQSEVSATAEESGIIEVAHDTDNVSDPFKLTEYRYTGKNPNNYMLFNNELWRIIGLVNTVEGQRVKLVRSDVLREATQMNSSSTNNWSNSNILTHYTDNYLPTFNEESLELIDEVTWNLGSTSNYQGSNGTPTKWYEYERGTGKFGANITSYVGKIGLITPSDYGYATSGGTSTNRTSCLNASLTELGGLTDCVNNNWLYTPNKTQWLFPAAMSNGTNYFTIAATGNIEEQDSSMSYADRPSIYLKQGILVKGGNGSLGNPYTI